MRLVHRAIDIGAARVRKLRDLRRQRPVARRRAGPQVFDEPALARGFVRHPVGHLRGHFQAVVAVAVVGLRRNAGAREQRRTRQHGGQTHFA
ncbi:hypothetical protein [Tahibacter soli]|uniref:Uncharacterized protein n=1 Tax=Tahibacter soli TaxID=2983605 RepID=A0A9X3YM87_9GAMM|nr:hypothetical protein [Tahibacter soli]MDC8014252.1 hypothetical protein [Tahibacter soli]